mgnify:CR=1 FL=1
MATARYDRKQRTLWSQAGPTPRLIFGAAIIAIVGVLGMTIFAATDAGWAAFVKFFLDGTFVDKDPRMVWLVPLLTTTVWVPITWPFAFRTSATSVWLPKPVPTSRAVSDTPLRTSWVP